MKKMCSLRGCVKYESIKGKLHICLEKDEKCNTQAAEKVDTAHLTQCTKQNYALGNPCLNTQSRTMLWETLASVYKEELRFGKPLAQIQRGITLWETLASVYKEQLRFGKPLA
jgi:hypothetical protein